MWGILVLRVVAGIEGREKEAELAQASECSAQDRESERAGSPASMGTKCVWQGLVLLRTRAVHLKNYAQ